MPTGAYGMNKSDLTLDLTMLDTYSFSSGGHTTLNPLRVSDLDVKSQIIREHIL